MIGAVRGRVTHIGADFAILDVGGLGYRVFAAPRVLGALGVGGEASLFTHHLVRDDQQALFGFSQTDELALFELLLSVSGIGPRLALAITGAHPVDRLQVAILGDDLDLLTSVPGVGRKSAQRILLELKEKIHAAGIAAGGSSSDSDVAAALQALGYSPGEARDAARSVASSDGTLEGRIRLALQELARAR
ncbi:MAG: Holliday junction branch migration protein RuvA [Candidatus Limnocylindria bacterium]